MAGPAPAEWSRRRVVGRAIVAILVVLGALPAYLSVEASWRPTVVRVSCALLVGVGCVRARRWVRDALEPHPISALDAPPLVRPAPELDPRFVRLCDDVTFSIRSRRYFDAILWPRLSELAGADLPRPAERRALPRRGPSLSALEVLIAQVERRA